MSESAARTFATPQGKFVLSPERPEDDAFLYALFAAEASAVLRPANLPEAMVEQLVAMQHHSQRATYRASFPDASYFVVGWEGQPIGRFVEHDEGERIRIVDIALLPEFQGRRLGSALMRALMKHWAARGCGARAEVLVTNTVSLKLHCGLGFVEAGPKASGRLELNWRPVQSDTD